MCGYVLAVRGFAEWKKEKVEVKEEEQEEQEVFTVELLRGPHGLGLALVDGMVGCDVCSSSSFESHTSSSFSLSLSLRKPS